VLDDIEVMEVIEVLEKVVAGKVGGNGR